MSNIFEIKRTPNTPIIHFDLDKGELNIEGRSIPEDPGEFYEPVMDKVKAFFSSKDFLKVNFRLEYVNSGSSKYLLGILRVMADMFEKGKKSTVNWYYEEDDESVLELGEHYKSSFPFVINLIEII